MKFATFPRIVSIALAGLFAGTTTLTIVPTSAIAAPVDVSSAIKLHNASRDGDTDATQQAVAAFTALLADNSDDPQTLAYLGSSYALTARDASSVVDKIRFTNRALRFLDQAVNMAPSDFTVRIIRGSVTSNLPAMFGRADSTVADYIALDQMFSVTQAPSMAPAMIQVYSQLAELAPGQDDWGLKLDAARTLAAGN